MMNAKTVATANAWHSNHRRTAKPTTASGTMSVLNIETSAQTLKVMTISKAGFLPYLWAMEVKSPYATSATYEFQQAFEDIWELNTYMLCLQQLL